MAKHPDPATSWSTYVELFFIVALVAGIIIGGLFLAKLITDTIENTKQNLKAKGYTVTDNGVAIKTNKRLDRDDYIDATQRGFIKTMGAASFKNAAAEEKKAREAERAAKEGEKPAKRSRFSRKNSS